MVDGDEPQPQQPGPWGLFTRLAERSLREFFDDHCAALAAAISYHVLFSIFPLAILLVGIYTLLPTSSGLRQSIVSAAVGSIPLSGQGDRQLRNLLDSTSEGVGTLGVLGVLGLVWAASGMMGSIRLAVTLAWDAESGRPFLRGKLIDLLLLFALAVLALATLGLTIATHLLRATAVGPAVSFVARSDWLFAVVVPFLLAFAALVFAYAVLPAAATRVREIWPGALFAAIVFVGAENGFALYLRHFARYNRIYGSLAVAVVFMLFVYLAANVFLLGAEVSSEWPRLRAELARGEGLEPGLPFSRQLLGFLRGLVLSPRERD
ncbi:MAG: YihY/virulence factor BrkB family protein [Gaiellaceae bacterium]